MRHPLRTATLALLTLVASYSAASSFLVAPAVPLQASPNAIASGDLNGDGHPDIVTANAQNNTISLLLGRGKAGFSAEVELAAPLNQPQAIVTADLNGDGNLDLIVSGYTANNSKGAVAVLLGNGNGTFQTPTVYLAGTLLHLLVLGDVNNDHIPDLLVPDGTNIGVYVGNGDGTFQPEKLTPAGATLGALGVGDFNGDGKLDVAVSDYDANRWSYLGNGAGSFTEAAEYQLSALQNILYILPSDINADGKTDLLVSTAGGTSVGSAVDLLGNGDGTFQDPVTIGASSGQLALADLNHDGFPDLISLVFNATLNVFFGRGNGSFRHPDGYFGNALPVALTLADFDGDGNLDIATANLGYAVSVFSSNPRGRFRAIGGYALTSSTDSALAGDFNGDGLQDIVNVDSSSRQVSVLLADGAAGYFSPLVTNVKAYQDLAAAGDLNNDGNLDLVLANDRGDGEVTVLLGKGNGHFQHSMNSSVGGSGGMPVLADLNADGFLDLVLPNTSSGSVTVALGNGDGTFVVQQGFLVSDAALSAAVGDFNRDGIPDIVVAGLSTAQVFLGLGGGSFGPLHSYSLGSYNATSIVVADVNGDGDTDLLVSCNAESTGAPGITLLAGHGNGSFGSGTPVETSVSGSGHITLVDLDGDGVSDIVSIVSDQVRSGVYWLRGSGAGNFDPPVKLDVNNTWGEIVADMNGDGRPDLVVSFSSGIGVALNGFPGSKSPSN